MAAQGGRPRPSLIEALFEAPRRFGFFQAVRILEAAGRRNAEAPVGGPAEPRDEVVRFAAQPSLAFPGSEIESIERPIGGKPPRMTVSFFGLTGPTGILPHHYTALLIRSLRQKSESFRDFLDLFNHRLLSLFVRAAAKYRLPLAYESNPEPGADPISVSLRSIVGLGAAAVRSRTRVGDETLLHYGGLFGHFPRSAAGLEAVLSGYFGRPVRVEQFFGRWMALAATEQTALPSRSLPDGAYCQLGSGATIGARVWDVQGSFRLHVGPLDFPQFLDFMPDGKDLKRLAELTELYVGPAFVFDVRLTLNRNEVPSLRLASGPARPRLGWNTWLSSAPPPEDASDAVFLCRTAA